MSKAYRPLNITKYDPFWKPVPAPGAHPDEPNFLCVSFNENWLPYILGALEPLRWTDKYQGDEATRTLAARRAENLIYLFMSAIPCEGDEMRLRQKPGSPCVMQASYDTGNTWVDVFDYAACFGSINKQNPPADYVLTYNNYQQYISEARAIYSGNPDNLTPQGSVEVDSNNLNKPICVAARSVVLAAAAIGIEEARNAESSRQDLYTIVTAGLGAAALIGGAVAAFPVIAGSIGISAALGGKLAFGMGMASVAMPLAGLFDNADVSLFENESAIQDVTCCMINALNDSIPTEVQFRQSLDNCSLSGDSEELRFIVREIIQHPDIYLHFLIEIEGAYQGATNSGIDLGTCPCDSWCQYWLDDGSTSGLTITEGTLQAGPPAYIEDPLIDINFASASSFFVDSVAIELAGVGTQKASVTIYTQATSGGAWDVVTTASRSNGVYTVAINETVFGVRVRSSRDFSHRIDRLELNGNGNEPALQGASCPS